MAAAGGGWKGGKFTASQASAGRKYARLSGREKAAVVSARRQLGNRIRFTQDMPLESANALRRSGLFKVEFRPSLHERDEGFVRVNVQPNGVYRAFRTTSVL